MLPVSALLPSSRSASHLAAFPPRSEDCRKAVTDAISASQQDYRLDYGISTSCAADAASHCEMEARVGRGQVLACLIKSFARLRGACSLGASGCCHL